MGGYEFDILLIIRAWEAKPAYKNKNEKRYLKMRKNNSRRIAKKVALGLTLGILFLSAIYLEGHCTRE